MTNNQTDNAAFSLQRPNDGYIAAVSFGGFRVIEKYPLSRVAEAYEQMHSGKVRFRVVLTMDG